jgi:N-formylmaleamate deformylase
MSPEAYAQSTRASMAQMVTDPATAKRVGDWSAKSDPKTVAEALSTMLTTDLRPGLSRVKVPVLLVGSSNPMLSPEATLAVYSAQVKGAPQARTVIAEGSRHFVMYDAPDFFHAQLDAFLKDVGAAKKAER